MTDVETKADLERLIRAFYSAMFDDPVMGPIFVDVVKMDLEAHVPTMVAFWSNHLWQNGGYKGGMMAVHFRVHHMAPLEQHHFMRWMDYWESTIDSMFAGPNANHLKMVASRVAGNLSRRIDEYEGRVDGPMAMWRAQ